METEVLEVKILAIQEDSFFIDSDVISLLDKTDNPGIEFFISFKHAKIPSMPTTHIYASAISDSHSRQAI